MLQNASTSLSLLLQLQGSWPEGLAPHLCSTSQRIKLLTSTKIRTGKLTQGLWLRQTSMTSPLKLKSFCQRSKTLEATDLLVMKTDAYKLLATALAETK